MSAQGVDGVRIRLHGASPPGQWRRLLSRSVRAAVWDMEVLASGDTDWAGLRRMVPEEGPARLIVLPPDADSGSKLEITPAAWVQAARTEFRDVVECVGGGTQLNFAELQRHELRGFDVVSFTYSPRVHAEDPRSIEESLGAYPAIVATLREHAPWAEVSVGPLRDPWGLPDGWVQRSVQAWLRAGADVVCLPTGTLPGSPGD